MFIIKRQSAIAILASEQRPLYSAEILNIGLDQGLITTEGKTPQCTLSSVLNSAIKNDAMCPVVKLGVGLWGLRSWQEEGVIL